MKIKNAKLYSIGFHDETSYLIDFNNFSDAVWSGCNNYNYSQKNVDTVDADYIEDPYYYSTGSPSRKNKGTHTYVSLYLLLYKYK